MKLSELKLDPKRFPKTLELNRYKANNQKYVFWDIETSSTKVKGGNNLDFKLAVMWMATLTPDGKYINGYTQNLESIDEFYAYFDKITQKYSTLTFIAHNTQFDLRYSKLLEYITDNNGIIRTNHMTQGTNVIQTEYKSHKQVFLDSMNWFSFSLEKLGKIVGVHKGKIDFNNCSIPELFAYCKQDVNILLRVFMRYKKWLSDTFGTNISYTRGADAFGIWRRSRNADKVHLHLNLDVLKKEIIAYHGGRTECFKMGKLPKRGWIKIDVNSLYPYVMSKSQYPTNYLGKIAVNERYNLLSLMDNYTVLGLVKCNIKDAYLPVYSPRGLYFPVGKIYGWFTGDELRHLLYNATDLEIIEAHKYEQDDIFSDVISKLMYAKNKAEKEGNIVDRTTSKLLMNSIYGKFGQRNHELKDTDEINDRKYDSFYRIDENNGYNRKFVILNHRVYEQIPSMVGKNSSPIISACVTANARMYLYYAMRDIGIENIAYVDTDSIILKDEESLLSNIEIHPTDLGKWKVEERSEIVKIYSPKNYQFGTEIHRKGIPKKAVEKPNNVFEYLTFGTLKSLFAGVDENIPHVRYVTRQLKDQYWKAILHRNHKYQPFTVNQGNTPGYLDIE